MGGQCCEEEVGEGTESWILISSLWIASLKQDTFCSRRRLLLVGWVKYLSLRRQCLSRISFMHINEKWELLKIERLHLQRSSVKNEADELRVVPFSPLLLGNGLLAEEAGHHGGTVRSR